MIGLVAGAAEAAGLIQTRRRRSLSYSPDAVHPNHKIGDDKATLKETVEGEYDNNTTNNNYEEREKQQLLRENGHDYVPDDQGVEEEEWEEHDEEFFSVSVLGALYSLVDRQKSEDQSMNLSSLASSRDPLSRISITASLLAEDLVNPTQSTLDILYKKREIGERYEGPYAPNGVVRHGDGAVCIRKDGSKFLGSYLNDEPFYGTLVTDSYTYNGTFFHKKFHSNIIGGVCALAQSDGTVYIGEFSHGKYHGVGKMVYPDGHVYTGNFNSGLRHGVGTLVSKVHKEQFKKYNLEGRKEREKNGENNEVVSNVNNSFGSASYSGVWSHDLKDGEGAEITIAGEVYQGQFSQDHRQGSGIITYSDGTTKEGTWIAGIPVDGPNWIITYPDGAKYNGNAVNCRPHGHGTMKYPGKDGEVYTGEWRNGVRHGKGLTVYENGKEFSGRWDDDSPVEEKVEIPSARDDKKEEEENVANITEQREEQDQPVEEKVEISSTQDGKEKEKKVANMTKEGENQSITDANEEDGVSRESYSRHDSLANSNVSLSTVDVDSDINGTQNNDGNLSSDDF